MNKTIRRLREEIERRGGQVHINENLPDDIMEIFLREVLACPDCAAKPQAAEQKTGRGSSSH